MCRKAILLLVGRSSSTHDARMNPPAKRARVDDQQLALYDSKDKQIVVSDNVRARY